MTKDKPPKIPLKSYGDADDAYAALLKAKENLDDPEKWLGVKRIVVIGLNTTTDSFDIRFVNGNVCGSDLLAALDCMKALVLTSMNYSVDPDELEELRRDIGL